MEDRDMSVASEVTYFDTTATHLTWQKSDRLAQFSFIYEENSEIKFIEKIHLMVSPSHTQSNVFFPVTTSMRSTGHQS